MKEKKKKFSSLLFSFPFLFLSFILFSRPAEEEKEKRRRAGRREIPHKRKSTAVKKKIHKKSFFMLFLSSLVHFNAQRVEFFPFALIYTTQGRNERRGKEREPAFSLTRPTRFLLLLLLHLRRPRPRRPTRRRGRGPGQQEEVLRLLSLSSS